MAYDEEIIEQIRRRLDRPIVLIGLMGAGKTRTGRQIAQALRLPFTDSDDEIEAAAGMSVSEIFERFGEEYFRDGERRVIQRLLDEGASVIATGGGAVMNEDTAQAIWDNTLSIWIRAELNVMVQRTARRDSRPLLKSGDPEKILAELAGKRYPVYEKADIVVDSHNGPAEAILNQALEKIRNFLNDE
ncbi:MAG: shikimate kinase [Rhodospirillales bacterium]|nr:shikimate kinase [Rhodospirillales bacterium]MCB9995895.1 shikimate kinase [Rhodospirillales bacterium]